MVRKKVLLGLIVVGLACTMPHTSAGAAPVRASDRVCIEGAISRASAVVDNRSGQRALYNSLFDENAIINRAAQRSLTTGERRKWRDATQDLVLETIIPALRPYANTSIIYRDMQRERGGVRKIIGVVGHGTKRRTKVIVFITGTCTFVDVGAKGFTLSGLVRSRMQRTSSSRALSR